MDLSDHDLLQLDDAGFAGLSPGAAACVAGEGLVGHEGRTGTPDAESLEQFAAAKLARALAKGRGRARGLWLRRYADSLLNSAPKFAFAGVHPALAQDVASDGFGSDWSDSYKTDRKS